MIKKDKSFKTEIIKNYIKSQINSDFKKKQVKKQFGPELS